MTARLVSLGSILVDVVLEVPHLPERGGDVLAGQPSVSVGGGFNVLAAAARQGVECVWAGGHGQGQYGELVRTALGEEGVRLELPASVGDTGVCFVLVEPDGERTFVTSAGVDAELTADDLAQVRVGPDDLVYLSGYDLAYPTSGPPLAAWAARLERGPRVVFDPGPLVAEIPADRLAPVLARTDVLTVNEREADLLAGDPDAATGRSRRPEAEVFARLREAVGPDAAIVVRRGPAGCSVQDGAAAIAVAPGHPVVVVDATGAGDCHTGVLIAGLAEGRGVLAAAARANVAAALAVTRHGPATAPTSREIDAELDR